MDDFLFILILVGIYAIGWVFKTLRKAKQQQDRTAEEQPQPVKQTSSTPADEIRRFLDELTGKTTTETEPAPRTEAPRPQRPASPEAREQRMEAPPVEAETSTDRLQRESATEQRAAKREAREQRMEAPRVDQATSTDRLQHESASKQRTAKADQKQRFDEQRRKTHLSERLRPGTIRPGPAMADKPKRQPDAEFVRLETAAPMTVAHETDAAHRLDAMMPAEILKRSLVLTEVFGPCRAMKPFVPRGRVLRR